MLLCYPHHVETNDVTLYSPERLRSIKAEHERLFGQKVFKIDESLLHKVSFEMEEYWRRIDVLHKEHHVASDLAIEIDSTATFSQLADVASHLVHDLHRIRDYLIESDQLRMQRGSAGPGTEISRQAGPNDFEILYIGFANVTTKLSVALTQMEIKYLEEYLKLNPDDRDARQRLEERKEQFTQLAVSAGYVD
jgi:hypothetical protein